MFDKLCVFFWYMYFGLNLGHVKKTLFCRSVCSVPYRPYRPAVEEIFGLWADLEAVISSNQRGVFLYCDMIFLSFTISTHFVCIFIYAGFIFLVCEMLTNP